MNELPANPVRSVSTAPNATMALQRLARAVVPRLADFCLIFLATGVHVRCVAAAHATPAGERLLLRLARVYKITRDDPVSTVAHVLRTGRPKLHTDIQGEASAPLADLRVYTLHRRLGARSALVVPIRAARRAIGAISLSFAESGRRYSAQDLQPARRLAATAEAFLHRSARPPQAQAQIPIVQQRRPLRLRARA